MCSQLSRYVCCSLDVTIAARFISFTGMIVSVILMTVLMNDKYLTEKNNYEISRTTALAFGLDWRYFHVNASIKAEDDPDGRMVSIIVAFYSAVFLFINLLLFFGSIKCDWCYAVPWLLCEFLGCLSKVGALIYHLNCKSSHLSTVFIAGSVTYIGIAIWWWLVVFLAQRVWKCSKILDFGVEMSTPKKPKNVPSIKNNNVDISILGSPKPYRANSLYSLI